MLIYWKLGKVGWKCQLCVDGEGLFMTVDLSRNVSKKTRVKNKK